MVKSMTGYGINTFYLDGTSVTVEIKSVNSRYLDYIPKLPRSLQGQELDIKKCIQRYFHRGRIEVYVSLNGKSLADKVWQVDWDLMDQYMENMQEMKTRYGLTQEVPLSVIAAEDALFSVVEEADKQKVIQQPLLESVTKAAVQVVGNRQREGAFLLEDINGRIRLIHDKLTVIEGWQEQIQASFRDRIKERITSHIDQQVEVNHASMYQEIALLAERGDVQEELTRLFSHLQHFGKVVAETVSIGRKLDFITQEMHREANTIGSKSLDAKVSEMIVIIKGEIEKIKEQVQNIE